jgi:hypothetical protein
MIEILRTAVHKRTLEELESFFFYTLFLWTTTFISPLMLSYHDFLVIVIISCILLVYLGCLTLFMIL